MQFYFSGYIGKPNLEEFETFADNLQLNQNTIAKNANNTFLIVLLVDLNSKLGNW